MTAFREGVDKAITRRQFLNTASLTAGVLPSFVYGLMEEKENGKPAIGLCGAWTNAELAKNAGCAYIEAGVSKVLMPGNSDAEFKKQFEALSLHQPLQAECFSVFLPRELKSVGDQANHEGIIQYASVAFKRAEIVGAKIIVFGSSGSRTMPDGFDRTKAKEQFISLCRLLAPIASRHNITLAVEQLNHEETNFINTMHEAAEIVEAIHHPNLKMICDIYHALKENDPASEILRYQEYLVHCHIAEKKDRTPPGVNGEDFTPYLSALKKINYKGRVSLECNWKNLKVELPLAVKVLQQQYENA
jgi:sugar phosphate isomerase/epimerase